MANTIMSAKNSFLEGLIIDFAPDNTQATCMTSALNATLLTFNGNEMSLQNDMGNARVETAYLPEGYVPVGSCEFGDIIYIVSYNPLTDKSQIGCFPSPERNISSEELYEAGESLNLKLSALDFLEFNNRKPTGKIKSTSVKKVLIESKKLNPGDKYIIYSDENIISSNSEKLSDYGPDAKHDVLPKYVKLHIVSIEDSGKITYLDSTTKWYDVGSYKYYINKQKSEYVNKPDIDNNNDLVSSAWSIFSSKVSGKLAILAELEMPESFSCSYNLELVLNTEKDTEYIKYKTYKLLLLPEAKGKLPAYICLTKASFNITNTNEVEYYKYDNSFEKKKATNILPNDNSGWDYSSVIEVGTIEIPYQLRDDTTKDWVNIESESFIYNLEVTPAMPYGRLEQFSIPLTINFNKVGTGDISLTTWKYYNSGNTSILTYGIEAYPKPNWNITEIAIQFYDNQGLVAEYLLNDRKSYSGIFTEYLGLNGEKLNSRLTRSNSLIKEDGKNTVIYHKGNEIDKIIEGSDSDNYVCERDGVIGKVPENYEGTIYLNDAGTLYSGFLYVAKIVVKQLHKNYIENPQDNLIEISEPLYRWFWTNSMFNEYYYSSKDFKELNFELVLNGEALFETTLHYIWKQKELNNLNNDFIANQVYNTNSANVQYIGYGKENNINMYINAGLLNNYDCFNLIHDPESTEKDDISGIDLEIRLSNSEINYSIPEKLYEFSVKEENISNPSYLALNNIINNEGNEIIATKFLTYLESPSSLITTEDIKDMFNIYFTSSVLTDSENIDGINTQIYKNTLDTCYYESQNNKQSIPLSMQSILFNKAYVLNESLGTVLVPVYTPIIDSSEDLNSLGIIYNIDNTGLVTLAFKYAVALCHHKNTFSAALLQGGSDGNDMTFNYSVTGDDDTYKFDGSNRLIDLSTNTDFLNEIWGNINPNLPLFFPVYLGGYGPSGHSGGTEHYNAISGTTSNYIPVTKWKYKVKQDSNLNNSKLTDGSFDIHGSELRDITAKNSISFLGVKYKKGMTVLNTAFIDGQLSDGDGFTLTASNYSDGIRPDYDNFAYLLFLLLTNTYHKNKKIENQQIKLKNYVRNGDYDIELIKHIIIKLSAENSNGTYKDMNIALRGINFKDYKLEIIKRLGNPDINNKNVTLRLLSFANDHELKIQVKNLPMSFFNTDVEAYIRKLGVLLPVSNISPNDFYIYQNEELQLYSNGILTFKVSDVNNTLAYIFKNEKDLKLGGARCPEIEIESDYTIAYNNYVDLINGYISAYSGLRAFECSSYSEAWYRREQFINTMFDTFPDSVNNVSKNVIRNDIEANTKFEDLFTVTEREPYTFIVNNIQLEYDRLYYNADYYQFNTHKFLSIFDYLNRFTTKETLQLGSTFGFKDGGSDENSAYTECARDILLDTNYLVV